MFNYSVKKNFKLVKTLHSVLYLSSYYVKYVQISIRIFTAKFSDSWRNQQRHCLSISNNYLYYTTKNTRKKAPIKKSIFCSPATTFENIRWKPSAMHSGPTFAFLQFSGYIAYDLSSLTVKQYRLLCCSLNNALTFLHILLYKDEKKLDTGVFFKELDTLQFFDI